jgi:hypothetical protein
LKANWKHPEHLIDKRPFLSLLTEHFHGNST